jgi:hypothetical protein
MPTVSTLTVDLVARTASFEGPLSKAADTGKRSSKDIQDSFNKMDFGEARGGLMLVDELLGVHLPRHATAFASQIPGLMQAAAAAMPVAAIAAIGIGIVDAVDKMKDKQDELRIKALQVSTAWEESGLRIRGEIDAQTAKVVAFNEGPMAAFQFTFEHSASVAIGHLKDIQTQLGVTMKQLTDDTQKWLMVGLGDKPSRDLENFNAQLSSVMVQAESASGGDKFASIRAGLNLATAKASELQTKIDGIVKPSAMAGGMAMAAWQAQVQQTQAEADAIDNVIRNLLALSNLQSATNATKKTEGQQTAFGETQKGAGLDLSTRLADIAQLKSAAVLAFTETGMKIDQAKAKADSMFSGQELQAHLNYFSKLENAGGSFEERMKIAADKKIFLDKEMATASDALAAVLSKNTELTQTMQETVFKEQSNDNKEIERELMATASAKTRAMMQTINMTRAETDEEARASAIQQVHAFQRIADIQTEIKQLEKLRDAAIAKGQSTLAFDAAIANAQKQRQKDLADELIATGRLGNVFKGTMLQMAEEGKQWQVGLANTFKQTMGGLNSSLAAFAVTGQGNFRQLAVSALESFIQIGLAWVESKIMMAAANAIFGDSQSQQTTQTIAQNAAMALSAAGLSAANTLAATSAVFLPPVPEALSAAAFATGLTYAGFAAAERGAILPNHEMLVNTHPEEMILPQHISNFIVNAASNASGGGGTQNHFHYVDAKAIHVMDATGLDRVLTRHNEVVKKHIQETVRRMNY